MQPAISFRAVWPDTLPDVDLAEDGHHPDERLVGVAVGKVVTSDAHVDERLLEDELKNEILNQ